VLAHDSGACPDRPGGTVGSKSWFQRGAAYHDENILRALCPTPGNSTRRQGGGIRGGRRRARSVGAASHRPESRNPASSPHSTRRAQSLGYVHPPRPLTFVDKRSGATRRLEPVAGAPPPRLRRESHMRQRDPGGCRGPRPRLAVLLSSSGLDCRKTAGSSPIRWCRDP
jgi:hypothetical protein